MEELVKSREDREDKGNSATARRTWRNKLANLEATLVCNQVTKLLSGVECRATGVAKKGDSPILVADASKVEDAPD